MKILLSHNQYQVRGGEDSVFEDEKQLLENLGHLVYLYVCSNNEISQRNLFSTSFETIWNHHTYKNISEILDSEEFDLIHSHNFFPRISPSIFYAAKSKNIPVVQTLHNYRLWCLNAYFFRDGKVCEDCHNQPLMIPGIVHKCYRNSLAGSAVLASMLSLHRILPTWDHIDVFIALSEFAYEKFIEYGIPESKLRIKPNFVDPAPSLGSGQGDFALYAGRLSPEKGIETLLAAWSSIGIKLNLKIAGSGPLQEKVKAAASQNSSITYLGQQSMEEIYQLMGEAKTLIFPSLWYEGMPRTIIESFAKGTPVIASNLGAMATMIVPEHTGLHFQAGSVTDLTHQVNWMLEHPNHWQAMRHNARQEFERKYTAERNYEILMDIYQQALASKSSRFG